MTDAALTTPDGITTLEEGKVLDYVTQEPFKDTAKEKVRQRISRALFKRLLAAKVLSRVAAGCSYCDTATAWDI